MPNTNSAKKRLRSSARRTEGNRAARSRIATTRARVVAALDAGDPAQAETTYRAYCTFLDKAVKRGALKANSASRRKSRFARKLAALAS
jgi:small subunit ribosomal protein S20